MSLRRAVGADVNPKAPFHISTYISHPMIGPYSRLLKAVYPYKHLFIEEDLQEQLRSLFNTIITPNPLSVTLPSSGSTILSRPHSASLDRPRHVTTMQPSSSSLASALEMNPTFALPHTVQSSSLLHPSTQAQVSNVAPEPTRNQTEGLVGTLPPTNKLILHPQVPGLNLQSESPMNPTHESPAPPNPTLPAIVPDTIQSSIKSKKKRKRILPSDLLAKDIEELNRKRSLQQELRIPVKEEPMEATYLLGNNSTSAIIPEHPEKSKEVKPLMAHFPEDELATTNDKCPETSLSNEVPLVFIQEVPDSSSQSGPQPVDCVESDHSRTPTTLSIEALDVMSDHMVLDQPETLSNLEAKFPTSNQSLRVLRAHLNGIDTAAPVSNDQTIAPIISDGVDVNMVGCPTTCEQEIHVLPSSSRIGDIQIPDNIANSENCGVGHVDELPTSIGMEISGGPSIATENPMPPDSTKKSIGRFINNCSQVITTPPAPADPAPTAPPLLNPNSREASVNTVGQLISPAIVNPTPELVAQIQWSEAQIHSDVFGSEMRILAFQRGLQSESKVTIRFEIPQEQYPAIQLWSNRRQLDSTTYLRQSLCLSLGCYSKDLSEGVNSLADLSALPSHWPQAGELFMSIPYNGKRNYFSLSPPFQVTLNGLVDVSKFLQPGSNFVELTQRSDMRDYVFILRAHYPTQSQLEEFTQRQKKNQDWQDWLHHVCRPLDVPIPTFS
ncbi:hypothetical protein BDZ94DRAFT_1224881 [Collybia nuda]|uniref:Uncharacterized protein n=1 Tax=Collybia nuda TaxID=64659 RepID=A0A9P5Y0Z1_9AGAR|nr:hypothetical protein BDZ94DRAFT_1224881 [Collybia nuda]